ncbi:TetR family transcriptional regulator [Amycolatopsis sp. CA-230715]|uniref:TetR family transcriptional regulator n=1 Tax=Amycolatopsis sp. CA-230715 TaxID=2745196 RepID=UPI001C025ED4|nr:TetR family transcriptional regulator [Amycolatopsis sp. CA-230715]QWF84773.1 hypothetical protein HUW46_08225 [Amycolatopsis sp. CA-230715]
MRRSDASRNREKILRVADKALASGTRVVPLAEIAHRVGLGRATVYRHFPDRAALGSAIAAAHLTTLAGIANEQRPFRDLLELVLTEQAARRPLVTLFRELPHREQRRCTDALVAALAPAFRRAQAEGQLRGDLELADLPLVFDLLETAIASGAAHGRPEASVRRIIAVVLDGLFAPGSL